MNSIKKISFLACIILLLSTISKSEDQDNTTPQTFIYDPNGTTNVAIPISQIEKEILAHIARRKLENWIFTRTTVHSASLQAIHAYNKLTPEKQIDYASYMQVILQSHILFLYHPLYWNSRKHINLVDNFLYSAIGERMNISPLDGIATPISVRGTTFGTSTKYSHSHSKPDKTK